MLLTCEVIKGCNITATGMSAGCQNNASQQEMCKQTSTCCLACPHWRCDLVTREMTQPDLRNCDRPSMTPYPTVTELPLHLLSTPILGSTRGVSRTKLKQGNQGESNRRRLLCEFSAGGCLAADGCGTEAYKEGQDDCT